MSTPDELSAESIPTVRDLRRRWKPTKESAAAAPEHDAIRIRLHRCFSWMQRVEDLQAAELSTDDVGLIYRWIGFNSIYGVWDADRRESMPDGTSVDTALRRLFEVDADGALKDLVITHKKLVKSLIGDEYLNKYFWKEPGDDTARRAQNATHKLASWYVEERYRQILDATLDRVYLARCQLVHGAATFDSRVNRTAVRRCARFMELFLPCACIVIIDHAWATEWGDLCYPPMG